MIIIQTATPPEFKSMQLAFGNQNVLIAGKRKCFQAAPDIFVLSGGLGKAFAAASTEYAIETWSPNLIIDFGAAGSLVDGLRRGDLVVADAVVEHDLPPLKKRDHPLPAQVLGGISRFPETQILDDRTRGSVGIIASGEENIETVDERRTLANRFGAIAVTWETASIGRVCHFHKVAFASVRMITDIGEDELLEEYKRGVVENLDHAARVFAEKLLPRFLE